MPSEDDGESLFTQEELDRLKLIAATPVVSKAFNANCKVLYVVGIIRMLKVIKSDVPEDRRDLLDFLSYFTMNSDLCVDNEVIAEVIDLGRNFTSNVDDANDIARLSCTMITRRAEGGIHPVDKRIAYAIHSGLLEMCLELVRRFTCDHSSLMMDILICIAKYIQAVSFHQKTVKAIRDRRSQIMQELKTLRGALSAKIETEKPLRFVNILSSIIDLNEGSCSRCNKPIEWRTTQFCGGCRRVVYCGETCQKEDWQSGKHSSDCSFLACSADVVGLTKFEVSSIRDISKLKALQNNVIVIQKKLFFRQDDRIWNQLMTYSDRLDYVVVFNLAQPIAFEHYRNQFTCSKQRKWFEEFRSLDKLVCVYMSRVLNGEVDEEGHANIISLYAAFPIPRRSQSSFFLYAIAKRNYAKAANPGADSSELHQIMYSTFDLNLQPPN
jgi:hypothetical protein